MSDLDFDLSMSLKIKSNMVQVGSIYDFLLVISGKVLTTPFWYVTLKSKWPGTWHVKATKANVILWLDSPYMTSY